MKKDCQHSQSQFPDYLTGDLDADTVTAIQAHIAACESCRRELEELTGTWTQLGILPEEQPGPNLRKSFYTLLESYQEALESKPLKKFFDFFKIKGLGTQPWFRRPAFQLALGLVILVTGFFPPFLDSKQPGDGPSAPTEPGVPPAVGTGLFESTLSEPTAQRTNLELAIGKPGQ